MIGQRSSSVVALSSRPANDETKFPAFDPSNPIHVRAWQALCVLGLQEERRLREGEQS